MRKIAIFVILLSIAILSAETIIDESFDNSTMPTGWTQEYEVGNVSWMPYSGGHNDNPADPHSGARNAYIFAETCTTKLVTPMLNIGGSNSASLTFWHAQIEWAGHQDILKVYYKTEPDDDWNLIETYDDEYEDWNYESISLPGESSSYFIAFEAVCDWGHGVVLDDVEITGDPSPVGVVEGHVYNENGIPVTGAEVLIEDISMSGITQPGGFYQILGVPEGTHPFFASLEGSGFDMTTATVIAGETITLDFNLQNYIEVIVNGTVETAVGGEPVQGATVSLEGFADYETQTAANGQFILAGVYSNNTYELQVTKPNHNPYTSTITIGEENYNCGTLGIYAPVEISGMVTNTDDPGAGLADAEVTLSGYENHFTTTDSTGHFLIEGVYANEDYQITIEYPDHNPYEDFLDVEGENIDLGTVELVSPVVITGWVNTTAYPDSGLAGAQVHLNGYQNHNVQTAANGQFLITNVFANEEYNLEITYPNHNPYQAVVEVEAEDMDLETLTLISPVTLTGHVVSNSDPETGISGADVDLSGYAFHSTSTDSLGDFEIGDIYANETYEISIEYPDHNVYVQSVDIDSEDLDLGLITLIGPVSVSGYVYGSDFPAIGLAGVELELSGYDTYNAETDSTGFYLFQNVFSNQEYVLEVQIDGYDHQQIELEVLSENLVLDDIVLQETTLPCGNVNATILDEYSTSISWNTPGSGNNYEFRYDDGNPVNEIGLNGSDAVIGAVHDYNAVITEVSWYLTDQNYHPHVKIYIFGLTGSGLPNSENLLYESSNISNSSNQWRTYTLPTPISAPSGFFVGVSTPNRWTDLAMDDGNGEPWIFENGTQFSTTDWEEGNWMDISGFPNAGNLLLRAYGMNLGPSIGRVLEGYALYRLREQDLLDPDEWEMVAEGLSDTTFIDSTWWYLDEDTWHYAVRCQHTNGVESIASYSNALEKDPPPEFEVELNVTDISGNPLQYAIASLSGYYHSYNANSNAQGIAVFDEVNPGVYDLHIVKEDYDDYDVADLVVTADMQIEVTMLSTAGDSNQILYVNSLEQIYPNPFNPQTEISFQLKDEQQVNIDIYNLRGQKIADLIEDTFSAGFHEITWNAKDQPSGIYLIRFQAGSTAQLQKAVLLK